ncbi:inositol monophosphatase family protein [Candidatus Blastococcus massiliensis]|uniref:inositol monophosphatase family protein n=1 Tax=Candidatus Blastococcus massiliensis TaxID=1470358 RepID=UPI0004AE2978|nr:inositol monophosphatase family protein [Candidatus Blastococcus massiliensis]
MPERSGLRAATEADLEAVGEALGMSAPALTPALLEPGTRVLVGAVVGAEGQVVLLRRYRPDDATAEAVVVRRAGVPLDHPDVLAAAVGWGCQRVRHEASDRCVPVPAPSGGAPLAVRFVHLAALAATRVETGPAQAARDVLGSLGLPVLDEGTGDPAMPGGRPWIALATREAVAGVRPRVFSAALVHEGRPVAGLVADLSSGHRWSAVCSLGARRDGVPVRTRPGSARRRSGCTAVDLCLVADGAAAAWHDADRRGTTVHDVAGGLAVLLAAGGTALTHDGRPLSLRPDAGAPIRFVAAADETTARGLLDALG